MKKLLLIPLLMLFLGFTSRAGEKHEHIMAVHGWIFDIFTGMPVNHHWVYFNSHNNNAQPHVDSARTNFSGHYHFDSIICQNNALLDIEIYTMDCHQNKHSYHIYFYDFYYTLNFTLCVGPSTFCKSAFAWEANPLNSLQVQFNEQTQGNINKWFWNFGDGNTSDQPDPSHIYASAGTYQVSLQVMDTTVFPPCIDSDTQNITVVSVSYFNLAGQVFAGSFPHPEGMASIHYLTPQGYIPLDSCELNVNGVYVFYQVPEGNYLVQVSRVTTGNPATQYWPTYFGNTLTWQTSQYLNLQTDYFQADITLQPLVPVSYGPGRIGGNVYRDNSGNLEPVADVEIMLADDDLNYITFVYSDAQGKYEFADIPYGTYHLHGEIPGVELPQVTVTIDANQPEIGNVMLMVNGPLNGTEEYHTSFLAGQIYPNPASGQAYLEVSLGKPAKVELSVYDILGKQKLSKMYSLDAGKNLLQLPLQDLEAGTYVVNLATEGKLVQRKKFELIR